MTFDFDGVLCRPPFGINPGRGHGKSREGPGKGGLLWATERWRYHFRKPMPGAAEGFRAIAERYRVAIVTARGGPAEALTARWCARHLGVIPELHTRPHWNETSAQYKARKMCELQPIAHFEDDPFTAEWLAELVPHVFLVDWPRNRGVEGANVYRVGTIVEAVTILESRGAAPA